MISKFHNFYILQKKKKNKEKIEHLIWLSISTDKNNLARTNKKYKKITNK